MKKLVLVSSLLLTFSLATAQEHNLKEDLIRVKDDVAEDVKQGWDASKEKVGELSKDAKQGVEKASDSIKNKIDSMHSTYEVSDAESLKKYLGVEILEVKLMQNNELLVKAELKNLTDKPVEFDDIMSKTDLIVLNAEEIAHFATDATYKQSKDLVVPVDSSIVVEWFFKDADSKPNRVRIFDVSYPLVVGQ